MRVYVAGSSHELARCELVIAALIEQGHSITHDWTKHVRHVISTGKSEAYLTILEREHLAREDFQGVVTCELFVLLEGVRPIRSIGASIECGIALAHADAGTLEVAIVAPPKSSIFYELADWQFRTDAELITWTDSKGMRPVTK